MTTRLKNGIGNDMDLRKRVKKAVNADNILDVIVDMSLILFDVLSSPILIVMRVFRYFFNKFIRGYFKKGIRWIVNKL
jgi:hypothetical protein|tara:strand:+ start:35 stop:268 length:234 start_codon:yes stop_codon:yes gene_type:complete